MHLLVARQPILDRKGHVYAYELLFRSNDSANEFDGTESDSATLQVLSNALMSVGVENLLRGKRAFINFDRRLLLDTMYLSLPRESFVIEILESIEVCEDLIAMCESIHQRGYSLALDDFIDDPKFEPLTRIAKVIKVDMRVTSRQEQQRLLGIYQPRGIAMLAEKVETQEEFEWARAAGYDYFQGYFFARPVVVRSRQIPAIKATCLRLLRELQSADLDFLRVEELIAEDVSLTYKLLRYANSALFERRDKVQSIARALVVLGEANIRRWVALATLPMLATDKPGELVVLSLVRARFCERLCQLTGLQRPDEAFLMGMFSLLDALIETPLDEALKSVDLNQRVTDVLLEMAPDEDVLNRLYRLIRAYETANWDTVEKSALRCGIAANAIGKAYVDATEWADQVMADAHCL